MEKEEVFGKEPPESLKEKIEKTINEMEEVCFNISILEDNLSELKEELEELENELLDECEDCEYIKLPIMECRKRGCPIAKLYVKVVSAEFRR